LRVGDHTPSTSKQRRTSPPVPVVAAQVAQVCAHVAKGHLRLDAALTEPAVEQLLAGPARAFRALLESHGERLAQRYGLHLSENWPDDPSTLHSRAAQFGDTRLAYVFGPKIATELIDDLEALGLAQRGGARDPRWIGMHPRTAAMYMTALADAMAARRKAQPVSDDALSHIGIGDITMVGLAEALLDDDGEAREEAEGSPFHPGVTGEGQTGRVNRVNFR
jgi:hypothetical protein